MNNNTYTRLLELIRQYAKTTDRLPPEDVLAQKLGISRVKLRDFLATMQANGFISRKKGIGTLINKNMLAETARLDLDTVYEEMIAESGYTPSTLVQKIKLTADFPAQIQEQLELGETEKAYKIEKTAFANDAPAIFTIDYIPARYYNEEELDIRGTINSTCRQGGILDTGVRSGGHMHTVVQCAVLDRDQQVLDAHDFDLGKVAFLHAIGI